MEYKLNKYQTPVTEELLEKLPREVRADLLEYMAAVPFISWLISSEETRGFAKDRPKHSELEEDDERKLYEDNRIVVDVVKPHILDNMDFFRERAIFFDKHGVYTHLTPNPNPKSEYALFWKEEVRRWKDGLIRPSDGEWIPGGLYFYWNYSPIWQSKEVTIKVKGKTKTRGERVRKFPKPWLGDYLFFHYLEQCRENGQHAKLLKCRGIGFSFKMGSISPRNMYVYPGTGNPNFHLASDTTFLSGDSGVFGKVIDTLDWVADNTPLPKLRINNSIRAMEIQLGYQDEYGVRKGLLSSVKGISMKDNPDKARGIRGPFIHYEEDGVFPNLESTWNINRKAVEDGGVASGMQLSGGTGGSEGADFEGSEKLFYYPSRYNIYGIPNVFDKNPDVKTKCGFFWGSYLNRNKRYDEITGEPDVIGALIDLLLDRHHIKYNSTDTKTLIQRCAEDAITPQDAIMRVDGTLFPVGDLRTHLEDITPRRATIESNHYIGALEMKDSSVEWKPADVHPIRKFPHVDKNTEGAVVIFERPKAGIEGRYLAGCLTPGEKVMTDVGLMNVEDVGFERKLISEEGKLVNILGLHRLEKKNADIYTIKLSNTCRTTTFTKEHPIRSCTPKLNYRGIKKQRELKLPGTIRTYNFEYKTVDKLSLGDYIKVPNIYKKVNADIEKHWQDNSRIDRITYNPLLNKDFWYFAGLWLGDGWDNDEGYVSISFNKKEDRYIGKCCNIIETVFNKKPQIIERNNNVEIGFNSKYLSEFLTKTFGTGALNKKLPEWVLYLPHEFKKELLLGYLASDGCVTGVNKNKCSVEYVSISLELLEGMQHILFSLGIISSLGVLKSKSKRIICGRKCETKIIYYLRVSHTQLLRLNRLLSDSCNHLHCYKLEQLKTVKEKTHLNKTVLNCFFEDGEDYIYFKVKGIKKSNYTGTVYNFHCETNTFMCHNITTHNCDPYDDDSGTSLGSIYVIDMISKKIVASYTGRPKFADDFYEICRRLALYYKATINYENNKKGLFTYFSNKYSLHLLCDTPETLRDTERVKGELYGNKAKGTNATKEINHYARRLIRDWLLSESYSQDPNQQYGEESGKTVIQKFNYTTIEDIPLLEELISWNPKGNFDRISALGMAMILLEDKLKYREQKMSSEIPVDSFASSDFFKDNLPENYNVSLDGLF